MLPKKVFHVNDCAQVALTIVTAARARGLDWKLHNIPQGRLGRFLRPVDAYCAMRGSVDVVHVHYGLHYPYIAAAPSECVRVVHLHGSDVNVDLLRGGLRRKLVLASLQVSDRVVFSTPNLESVVRSFRPDAVFVPGALSVVNSIKDERRTGRVVVASRWDESKGSAAMLKTVEALIAEFPGIEVLGIDWGPDAPLARSLGVRLVPRMSEDQYAKFVGSASLAIGQHSVGSFGISELRCLAQGIPVVMPLEEWPGYVSATDRNLLAIDPRDSEWLERCGNAMLSSESLHDVERQNWVAGYHGIDAVLKRLEMVYQQE